MKPTNYHLFDFLDFDTELSRNESLWKAYKPTAVYEKEGDIYVTVPFQKQKLANDMMADTDVPQEEYTLIIRQYNIGITRLFLGFGDYVLTDESEMLQFSDRIQKVPLFIKEQKGKFPAGVDFTTDLHSMGQYIQEGRRNLFETVISIENSATDIIINKDEDNLDGLNYLAGKGLDYVNNKAMEGTIEAHVSGDVPNIMIVMQDLSEETIGQLIYFFELACAMSCKILGVNPFNQPGVEEYKKN